MKRSEIISIIAIASISVIVAYLIATAVIGKSTSSSVKVRTAIPISSTVDEPDDKIFNKDAINPTVEVVIGDN
ncbi:MAG: hypothetical protein WAW80_00880 [Candidatus Saccharimonadales bacterium]